MLIRLHFVSGLCQSLLEVTGTPLLYEASHSGQSTVASPCRLGGNNVHNTKNLSPRSESNLDRTTYSSVFQNSNLIKRVVKLRGTTERMRIIHLNRLTCRLILCIGDSQDDPICTKMNNRSQAIF